MSLVGGLKLAVSPGGRYCVHSCSAYSSVIRMKVLMIRNWDGWPTDQKTLLPFSETGQTGELSEEVHNGVQERQVQGVQCPALGFPVQDSLSPAREYLKGGCH